MDFKATAERIVGQSYGANYFSILQRTMGCFPWVGCLNDKMQIRGDERIAIANEFAVRLNGVRDFQDLARI
jgi:hypothetical protein